MTNTHSATLTTSGSKALTAADSASLDYTGDNTVEFWIKMNTQPTSGNYIQPITKGENGSGGFKMYYDLDVFNPGNNISLYQWTNTVNKFTSVNWYSQTLTTNTWIHVAVSITVANGSSTRYELCINGSSQGHGSSIGDQGGGAGNVFTPSTEILRINGGNSIFGDFQMDDVRIWAQTQSAATINSNKCSEIDSATNLQASWHLNNSLVDSSGNSNTLTNVNSVAFTTDVPSCFPPAVTAFPRMALMGVGR